MNSDSLDDLFKSFVFCQMDLSWKRHRMDEQFRRISSRQSFHIWRIWSEGFSFFDGFLFFIVWRESLWIWMSMIDWRLSQTKLCQWGSLFIMKKIDRKLEKFIVVPKLVYSDFLLLHCCLVDYHEDKTKNWYYIYLQRSRKMFVQDKHSFHDMDWCMTDLLFL